MFSVRMDWICKTDCDPDYSTQNRIASMSSKLFPITLRKVLLNHSLTNGEISMLTNQKY